MARKIVLYILLFTGLIGGCYVAGQRVRIESRNKAVEIVLDYDEIEQIAASTGHSTTDVMKSFKESGATSVAISSETMKDAVTNGDFTQANSTTYIANSNNAPYIVEQLKMALPNASSGIIWKPAQQPAKPNAVQTSKSTLILQGLPASYIAQVPVGLPMDAVKSAKAAGLEVIARLVNYTGATPSSINSMLKNVKSLGIKKIIFQGDEMLGFNGAVEDTAKAIVDNGLYFGRVEFSKQKGELTIAEKAKGNVITVHSISQAEMPTLSMPTIIDRFQKGVRERGVRMCYVRMFDSASPNILRSNAEYISKIAKNIEKAGYTLRSSHPLEELKIPKIMRVLTGIGVAAGAILLLLTVVDLSPAAGILWIIAALVICAGLSLAGETGRKLVAMLSALVFPTMAALHTVNNTPEAPQKTNHPLLRAYGRFIIAVLTVSAGGMLIVGLLSEDKFMLRINQFMGVKLVHLLPVLILAALFAAGIAWKSEAWGLQKRRFIRKFIELGKNQVLIWQIVGSLVLLVIVGIMVARSGNDSGVGVSALELKFRSILDKVLFVRPRTKEFLIGYPALIMGIAFSLRGRRAWGAPLVVVGSIGLISALNTFCHLHTPLTLSLIRVMNGAVVGGIIGAIAYWILRYAPGKEK